MYSDDNTWKLHYEDWKRIVKDMNVPSSYEKIDGHGETTKTQIENRIRTINMLIIDYEVEHKADHERGA
jgi:hypothetical protein